MDLIELDSRGNRGNGDLVPAERYYAFPRAENAECILTVGNARPLDQALQEATTEMVRWLVELGLEEKLAHIFLGQCVEYEVGNVFDPAYTMVCKVKKDLLESIGIKLVLP